MRCGVLVGTKLDFSYKAVAGDGDEVLWIDFRRLLRDMDDALATENVLFV